MGNFNRGVGSFDRGNRRAGSRFSGRDLGKGDRGPITMFRAICDECKKPCEVPFRPTAGKPVYCNDCFNIRGRVNQDRAPKRDFNDRPQTPRPIFLNNEKEDDIKKQLELVNSKLEKLISLIENFSKEKLNKKVEIVKNIVASLPKKEIKKKTIKK
ncbi:hypothetical protein CVV26_00440 [Candidatus Kuenenbacteria bacterium HGW-Kuenenbacteria-1]|uniref:CxxC-x17-CxxC domain-containing protein n=1 Tax=Candidatus Kuenenbacteria bacterium HGW-Kuenenbacteria-1 TaxID=2013812 RepID=A0A2N1UPE4_9BACT|nr:MAG: hypothetical protein CVV26_00440 [Candidatus Kuenenbacteria bacterium HGW-Kuenenbacteria-1]